MASLTKRPATSSAHELRSIRKFVLEKRKHRRSHSMSNIEIDTKEEECLFDSSGEKCSPKKKIGEGSSSDIFELVYDDNEELNDSKKVVKVLSTLDQNVRRDFDKEIKILERSNSPQIVKYFGTARDHPSQDAQNSEIGIILEYCENGDLYQYLKNMDANEESLDLHSLNKFCNDCILAIKYLHRCKIIHRDVKSLNYLVNKDKRIKLSDFGKAREDTAFNRDTTLRRLRTSPCWTAPELCDWDNDDESANIATYASDIFALTIVLWEMIYYHYHKSYRVPYTGNIYMIYNKITNSKRPKVDKHFSRSCKEFLKKGWNVNPVLRPSANRMIMKFHEIRFY